MTFIERHISVIMASLTALTMVGIMVAAFMAMLPKWVDLMMVLK